MDRLTPFCSLWFEEISFWPQHWYLHTIFQSWCFGVFDVKQKIKNLYNSIPSKLKGNALHLYTDAHVKERTWVNRTALSPSWFSCSRIWAICQSFSVYNKLNSILYTNSKQAASSLQFRWKNNRVGEIHARLRGQATRGEHVHRHLETTKTLMASVKVWISAALFRI